MSNHANRPDGLPPEKSGPGKRLEHRGPGGKPPLAPGEARKQREKRIMILMIVLAAVMVIAAAGVLFYNSLFKKPSIPPGPANSGDPDPSLQPGETPAPTLDIDAIQPKVGGERRSGAIYTVLIFGTDETSGLTDTMMVATYDAANQKAAVMSLPRDTLINSSARPNINAKKLNAVYNVYGRGDDGIQALRSEVSELVGFTPDYYVQIDWELVGEMVEAIGGVWFDIPYHMDYDDPDQDLYIHFDPGNQLLNGEDAMKVVRWRKNNKWSPYSGEGGGGDITRLKVQHGFLKAVLKQTLQLGNITKINQLITLFNSRVKSDLEVAEMLWLGREAFLGGLDVDNVEFCTMPYLLGSYRQFGEGFSFVYPKQTELLALINESFNPFVEEVTIRQLDLMSQNADGSLRSSTGRLADPSLGNPPGRATTPPASKPPEPSKPPESEPPAPTGPVETDAPPESDPPVETAPPVTEPPAEPAPAGGDEAA